MEQNVMRVENITKIFPGVKALSNLSMELRRGEIHAIVGENGAGKSTLMNIISGNMKPNEGRILLGEKEVSFESARDAQDNGISIVHQELATCPDITVGENIFMSKIDSTKGIFMNYKKIYEESNKLLRMFHSQIDSRQKMKELKVSDQQIIEIIKAISMNCEIIIFDEPTASITEQEAETLFEIIKGLKEKGISILYISHRMEEIFTYCDRVTILKDGCYIDTLQIDEVDRSAVIEKMVGRKLNDVYPPKGNVGETVIFEAKHVSRQNIFQDVSFQLKKGEILGFAGLIGSGRSEIMRSICGIDEKTSGEIFLDGKKIEVATYRDAVENGIVYLTEDRKTEGLMLKLSIKQNISALNLDIVSGKFFVNAGKEKRQAQKLAEQINVKCTDVEQKAGTLSGGNQQKVLIAKSLSIKPKVVIMDEPTRGIDVGAKVEIYKMLRKLANEGIGVIVISSELPEVIGICDSVVVVHEGRLCGELHGDELCETVIMHKASGY